MAVRSLNPRNIDFLAVHCSDSPQGRGDDAAAIHQWHSDPRKGFDLIGYHAVILEDGQIQAGRPEYCCGAHCPKINSRSLAVCLIGDGDFTEEQLISLREWLMQRLQKYPEAKVVGHGDIDPRKTCPNFDVVGWFESITEEYP
ncbi:MAG: N-acetylmuramoyl-L-alanine amidase [Cellvibrionaceae bacterium]